MLIAEDSTSFEGGTKSAWEGGLGFDYKWDLGWMNDTLDYFMKQSDERRSVPEKLTFSMFYFYNERHLLPLSHDEVVHGKKTVIDKIFGDYEMKFPQCRSLYAYMFMHPGKKLNFMGNEIAMFREWDETKEPDFFLLKYPNHDSFQHYFMELGRIYLEHPSLYELDYDPKGFRWVTINDSGNNIFGIQRYDRCGKDSVIAIFNFSGRAQTYWLHPEKNCVLKEILNSDWERFGGSTKERSGQTEFIPAPSMTGVPVSLPAFSTVLYEVK